MSADCHIHMVLDGVDWKSSIARGIDDAHIRKILTAYQAQGVTYLRDGGDRFGVSRRARDLAPEYGITYRTPLAPLHKAGHYGGFIGTAYDTLRDYQTLIAQARREGADFIKLMVSGLMDFDRPGVLTEDPLPNGLIHQLVYIAHEEGFSVMAHCNGARTITAAADAGVDSIEHGAYADEEALAAMAERGTVWTPTLSTLGNLLGRGRFHDTAVRTILEGALENVWKFVHMGGLVALGSDAGAWAVPHGADTERTWLEKAGLTEAQWQTGTDTIREKF